MLSENEEFMISIPEVNILFKEGPDYQNASLSSQIGEFCLDNCCEYLFEDFNNKGETEKKGDEKKMEIEDEKQGIERVR